MSNWNEAEVVTPLATGPGPQGIDGHVGCLALLGPQVMLLVTSGS